MRGIRICNKKYNIPFKIRELMAISIVSGSNVRANIIYAEISLYLRIVHQGIFFNALVHCVNLFILSMLAVSICDCDYL